MWCRSQPFIAAETVSQQPVICRPNVSVVKMVANEIHKLHITCCYVGQASDKLSGRQEQPLFFRWFA